MKIAWLKYQEGRCSSQVEGCKWKLPISVPDLCRQMRKEVSLTSLPTQQEFSITIDCGMWDKQQERWDGFQAVAHGGVWQGR